MLFGEVGLHDPARQVARGVRGGRGRCPGAPAAWARRQAASLVKLLALRGRAPAAPRAGGRGALAGRAARTWRARGCTRPPTTHAARSAATAGVVVLRNEVVALTAGRRRDVDVERVPAAGPAGAGGRHGRPRRPSRSTYTPGRCCPTTSTSRGPRTPARPCARCTSTCSGRPGAGRSCSRRTRPTSRPTSRWPGPPRTAATSAARCGSSSGWTRRCAGSSAPPPAPRPSSSGPGSRQRRPEAPARRGRRPTRLFGRRRVRRPGPRAARTGRGRPRQHPACSPGAPGVGQVRDCSTSPRGWPGSAAGGPAAARRPRSRGPGPTRRCWRRSATCAAGTRHCSTGSTTTTGSRSSGRCPGGTSPGPASTGHQRLFVAAAELVRLAAAGHGLLLVVDDLHEADEASLRLLHYLSRSRAHRARAGRAGPPGAGRPGRCGRWPTAWWRAAPGPGSSWRRSTEPATRRLLADRFPDLPAETVEQICAVSAGLPFTALELARQRRAASGTALPALPAPVLRTFERVALLGTSFTTDELLAVSACPRTRPTGTSRRRSPRWWSSRRHGGYRVPAPARPGGAGARRCRRTPPRPPAARWPSGSPRSARHRAGSPTSSSPPACRRARCRTCCARWRPPVRSAPTGTH